MTSQGSAHGRFTRAIERGSVFHAELAARELGRLSLDDSLRLVRLYRATGSEKYEAAAVRWLGRLARERSPSLAALAHATLVLAGAPAPDR